MKNDKGKHYSEIVAAPEVQEKLRSTKNTDELAALATAAMDTEISALDLSTMMRSIAEAELEKYGFPTWAINSMFLGEAVCW